MSEKTGPEFLFCSQGLRGTGKPGLHGKGPSFVPRRLGGPWDVRITQLVRTAIADLPLHPGHTGLRPAPFLRSRGPQPSGGEDEPKIVGNAPQSLPEALTLREQDGGVRATWVRQGGLLRGGDIRVGPLRE